MKNKFKPGTTCYMCNELAVTNEHVPPRSFFPKTIDGRFRIGLIKVPSCQRHNGDTSKTDELMKTLIYLLHDMNREKNEAARLLGESLLDFDSENCNRKISNIKKILFNNPKIIRLEDRYSHKKGETMSFNYLPLREHLISTFEKISCGLYFNQTGEKILGDHNILEMVGKPSSYIDGLNKIKTKQDILKFFRIYGSEFKGDNPLVFKYRFFKTEDIVVFHHVLYESLEILDIAEIKGR